MNDYNIYAKFNEGETFTISEQSPYQYNYGQKLVISGTNVNETVVQVHFSTTEKQGSAEQRVGTVENGVITVDLPDSLIFNDKFSSNYNIFAFVYVTDGKSGETLYKVQMNIIARPKPKEIITPDNSDMFDGVVAKVSEDAKRAESAANRAENALAGMQTDTEFIEQAKQEVDDNRKTVETLVNGFGETVTQAKKDIQDEGTRQIQDVQSEGSKQLGILQKETEQFQADREQIQKNKEKIDIISIENAVKGKVINISDSAEFPVVDYKVFGQTEQVTTTGKNLFDIKKITPNNNELKFIQNGVIMSNSKSGYSLSYIDIPLIKSGVYRFSCNFEQKGDTTNIQADGRKFGTSTPTYSTQRQSSKTGKFDFSITIPEGETGMRIYLHSNASGVVKNAVLELTNIQLELSSAATQYEPYTGGKPSPSIDYPQEMIDKTVKEIKVTGINLLKQPYSLLPSDTTVNGINVHINEDYSITLKGTSNAEVLINLEKITGIFTDTGRAPFTNNGYSLIARGIKDALLYYDRNNDIVFIDIENGKTINETVYPMITLEAHKDKPYEPYKEQIVTLSQPIMLRGIPVDSGGNYTDENGKQWICDEIDLKREVMLRHIEEVTFSGLENEDIMLSSQTDTYYVFKLTLKNPTQGYGKTGLCNLCKSVVEGSSVNDDCVWQSGVKTILYFKIKKEYLTSGTSEALKEFLKVKNMKYIYILETPIEIGLSILDQQALEKLHTFYPNTVVMTNEPVEQELTYVADPKLFIEGLHKKQEAEMQEIREAIVALGGKS